MSSSIAGEFGRRLREARVKRGLSQSQLARSANVSHSEIYRLEAGTREPRLGTVIDLARGLGIDTAELVVGMEGDG